jgi:hypothetical protein
MNVLWFLARTAAPVVISAAALMTLWSRFGPGAADLTASAIHVKNGIDEFRKAFETAFFGSGEPTAEERTRERESTRIHIE